MRMAQIGVELGMQRSRPSESGHGRLRKIRGDEVTPQDAPRSHEERYTAAEGS